MRHLLIIYIVAATSAFLSYLRKIAAAEDAELFLWIASAASLLILTVFYVYQWLKYNKLVDDQLQAIEFAERRYDATLLLNGEVVTTFQDEMLGKMLEIQSQVDEAFPNWRSDAQNVIRLKIERPISTHVDRVITLEE